MIDTCQPTRPDGFVGPLDLLDVKKTPMGSQEARQWGRPQGSPFRALGATVLSDDRSHAWWLILLLVQKSG